LLEAVDSRTEDEFLDLITWLPKDSAWLALAEAKGDLKRAQSLYGWSTDQELTLGLLNLIQHQTYVIQQVQTPKKVQPAKEIKGPRSKTPRMPKAMDANAIARGFMNAQKGG
jgi:hypothetical protein